jgi:hypothetical protein
MRIGHVINTTSNISIFEFEYWAIGGSDPSEISPSNNVAPNATAEVSLPADRTILEVLNPEHPSALPNPRTPPAMSASHKAFVHANFSMSQRYLSLGLSALRVGGRRAEQSLLTQLQLSLAQ